MQAGTVGERLVETVDWTNSGSNISLNCSVGYRDAHPCTHGNYHPMGRSSFLLMGQVHHHRRLHPTLHLALLPMDR